MNISKSFKSISFNQMTFSVAALSSVAIGVIFLWEYLSHQWFNLLLGCIAMSFVIHVQKGKKGNYRFAILVLLFMLFTIYTKVDTMVYFSLMAFVFFLIECHYGKVNFLAVLTAVLVMPISTYLLNTFSFPIRLWLTSVCGDLFRFLEIPVNVIGNTFSFQGNDFTVDPACMGLGMLTTSFLVGILLLGFYQKKYKKYIPIWAIALYLGVILILNIFSNLVRMMLLVLLLIYPDTLLHDIVGLLCFLFQVIFPLWAICYFGIPFFGKKENEEKTETLKNGRPYFKAAIQLICCVLLWITALYVSVKKEDRTSQTKNYTFAGYKSSIQPQGVTKLENEKTLVYLKQIRWFFDSEHNPMICWSGNGYTISHVQENEIENIKLYTGILQKGTETLYTAWWYDNGQTATNSQLEWRLDMLKGNPAYFLINVTVEDKELLSKEIGELQKQF